MEYENKIISKNKFRKFYICMIYYFYLYGFFTFKYAKLYYDNANHKIVSIK